MTFEERREKLRKDANSVINSITKILEIETREGTLPIAAVDDAKFYDIYRFTLPLESKNVKRVAMGFPTLEEALAFRDKHFKTKEIEVNGHTTVVAFEVVESTEKNINVFKNSKPITKESKEEKVIIEHDKWVG